MALGQQEEGTLMSVAVSLAEPRRAADCLQRPLLRRSGFRQQLTPGV